MQDKITEAGYILYRGASRIDGRPIVAIATMSSSNRKTGAKDTRAVREERQLVQVWILCEEDSPLDALHTGSDVSICGGCIHRKLGSCYVNVGQAPSSIWRSYKRGNYSENWDAETFNGLKVRLGAYGDPAAVPSAIWEMVTSKASGHTGYTHQWRSARLRDALAFCVASCDSAEDLDKTTGSTFRVLRAGETKLPSEITCPAESGNTTCAECMLCNGDSGVLVTISAHGATAERYNKS